MQSQWEAAEGFESSRTSLHAIRGKSLLTSASPGRQGCLHRLTRDRRSESHLIEAPDDGGKLLDTHLPA